MKYLIGLIAVLTLAACDMDGDGSISQGEAAGAALATGVAAVIACGPQNLNC